MFGTDGNYVLSVLVKPFGQIVHVVLCDFGLNIGNSLTNPLFPTLRTYSYVLKLCTLGKEGGVVL